MVKAYVKTESRQYSRALAVEFEGLGKVVLWGDPSKAIAALMLFNNSRVGSWTGKGLEVEASEEAYEAFKALSRKPPTWKEAADAGLLQNPTPQHVLQALSLKAILGG